MSGRLRTGFTLLEMLVVLVILGLSLAVVVPAINKGLGGSLDDASRDLQVGLRKARSEAVLNKRSVALWMDVNRKVYGLDSRRGERSLPKALLIKARVADSESRGPRVAVRFFPDGSSTGGHIRLSKDEGIAVVDVDWLTGRVSIRNGDE
ncbi:GspH/FimT family pseudopilin [Pseudomonas sp. RIT-PI-AD]|uniref:GspH/FimT family pseudopilin n=1 Tax=Pseudomonas sp. RIT-PI-AD TaxID=3035294 RepID=UPI0021DAAC11|nr:GspH/FimT family pseudopilin [Pseudomonas sp. RIT-PI-AD]